MKAEIHPVLDSSPGTLPALWLGWIGAPVWWLTQFEVRYILVQWACRHGQRWAVLQWGVAALAVSVGLAGWAWSVRGRNNAEAPAGFLRRGAAWSATFFTLLVLAQLVPDLFLDPCRQ
jgi:hypothetical protein